jgi:hypothetical protein
MRPALVSDDRPSRKETAVSYRLLLCSLVASAAYSATALSADAPPAQNFDEAKAHHLARLQKEIACVQAATNIEQMRACMPPPGGHRGAPPPN